VCSSDLQVFISENGFAKIEVALAKGKKLYDKRESMKEKDQKRDLDRRRND
jgi:SsrA-binding protein